jgi:hypothetical protein
MGNRKHQAMYNGRAGDFEVNKMKDPLLIYIQRRIFVM